MKQKQLLSLVLCFLLVLSSTSIFSETPPIQTEESMRNYIITLEKQLDYSKTVIMNLEKTLMSLENYKNNLTSYNLSTTKLTDNEKKTLEEEKLLRQQQEILTQEWEKKYQEVMKSLTITTKQLNDLEQQIKNAKDEYNTLYGDYEKEQKKAKFWQVVSVVLAVLGFSGGVYLGMQI